MGSPPYPHIVQGSTILFLHLWRGSYNFRSLLRMVNYNELWILNYPCISEINPTWYDTFFILLYLIWQYFQELFHLCFWVIFVYPSILISLSSFGIRIKLTWWISWEVLIPVFSEFVKVCYYFSLICLKDSPIDNI